jgi:hypothetical protein
MFLRLLTVDIVRCHMVTGNRNSVLGIMHKPEIVIYLHCIYIFTRLQWLHIMCAMTPGSMDLVSA